MSSLKVVLVATRIAAKSMKIVAKDVLVATKVAAKSLKVAAKSMFSGDYSRC